MKIFQEMKSLLRLIRVLPSAQQHIDKLWDILIAPMYAAFFLSIFYFIVVEAETFMEYSEALFYLTLFVSLLIVYYDLKWQRESFLSVFDRLEGSIRECLWHI